MCGLAGIVSPDPVGMGAYLESMGERLSHRGPDAVGYAMWSEGEEPTLSRHPTSQVADVGLVHRRLSIIDLSEGGWQPLQRQGSRSVIVFNGEIYNYIEIAARLSSAGVPLRTGSDTEVLAAALDHWGTDCVSELDGMFAFAWLDPDRGVVTLGRDRFGIKPLFLTSFRGKLAFASELPVLLAITDQRPTANPQAVYDYLVHGLTDHDSSSFVSGFEKVPPGCLVEVDTSSATVMRTTRYWSPPARRGDMSRQEAVTGLRDRFADGIRIHLRSDVPLGAALSGGVDSSAIVTMAREVGGSDFELHSFSFIADDPSIDESAWIDLTERTAGVVRHDIRVTADDLARDLPELVRIQGEPFGSTSIYAQFCVYRAAHEAGVTVMLDGQGADELLGGYASFYGPALGSLVRSGRIAAATQLARHVGRAPGGTSPGRLASLAAASFAPATAWKAWERMHARRAGRRWLDRSWVEDLDVDRDLLTDRRHTRTLGDALVESVTRLQLPALLRYADRNSMASSIESRVPFLDAEFAEYALSMPVEHMIDLNAERKSVFREAMRGLVPDQILDRRDKIGFATPELAWFRTLDDWIVETLSQGADGVPLVVEEALSTWSNVKAGCEPFDWRIWRLVNLITWAREFGVRF